MELEKYEAIKYETYSEKHCFEEIEKIKDIKNSAVENEAVASKADELIARIEIAIKGIKDDNKEREYQNLINRKDGMVLNGFQRKLLIMKRLMAILFKR